MLLQLMIRLDLSTLYLSSMLLLLLFFCPPAPFFRYICFDGTILFFRPFISDKTDLESTHSSNMSGLPEKQIIPPDALYSSNEKMMNIKNSSAGYISYEAVFNDSKVSFNVVEISLKCKSKWLWSINGYYAQCS